MSQILLRLILMRKIKNKTAWLTQKDMTMLFDVSADSIGLHIANILAEGDLDNSTSEKSSVIQVEGKRQVKKTDLNGLVSFWSR